MQKEPRDWAALTRSLPLRRERSIGKNKKDIRHEKTAELFGCGILKFSVLAPTYSYGLYWLLPSALAGLTAEFGMGSGVAPPLEAPGHWTQDDMKKQL